MLSRRVMRRPRTGAFRIAVWTVFPCHSISRGRPTFTESNRATVLISSQERPKSKYVPAGGDNPEFDRASNREREARSRQLHRHVGGKAAPSFSQPMEVRSRLSGSVPLPVLAKCCLPGLLRRELLGPRAHQCGSPRVAGVALKRIAPEEGPSAADA